jgi:hypothetical protein
MILDHDDVDDEGNGNDDEIVTISNFLKHYKILFGEWVKSVQVYDTVPN